MTLTPTAILALPRRADVRERLCEEDDAAGRARVAGYELRFGAAHGIRLRLELTDEARVDGEVRFVLHKHKAQAGRELL